MGLPSGPVVKGLPASAGDMGLIAGPDRSPHAVGQLGLCAPPEAVLATREAITGDACTLQLDSSP